MKNMIHNSELREQLERCPDLPLLPAVAVRVLELTGGNDVDAAAIARAVSLDPVMAARLLRTANSSFYASPKHVSSVHSAVILLGANAVRTLVLGFSLVTVLRKGACTFDHMHYWRRSLYAASAGRVLAMHARDGQPEECFLAALMMDVGMLGMGWLLGERYAAVVSKTTRHGDLAAEELQAFGCTHAEVTACLAERWGFPDVLRVPMAHHHSPETASDPYLKELAEIVSVASRCGDIFMETEPAGSITQLRGTCAERFGINEMSCDSMLCEMGMRTRQLAPLFDVSVPPMSKLEALLQSGWEHGSRPAGTIGYTRRRMPA